MSNHETPTGLLREEHQLILRVLTALERILDRAAETNEYDFGSIHQCIQFFRLFADACHHGKEEDHLFVELQSRGMPREAGPIAVMLAEHQMGRELVRAMADNIDAAEQGNAESLTLLVNGGRGFIDLLRNHIAKEDQVLFMMADQMVDPAGCRTLCSNYSAVCQRKFDGLTKEQLIALAGELEHHQTS